MKKKDRIDVLENEVENLHEHLEIKQGRIVELINLNDYLTLRYEPWRPEDDPYHGVDFYGLIEDNDVLTEKVLDKMAIIEELEVEIANLRVEPWFPPPKVKKPRRKLSISVAFDLFPLRDWFRLSMYKWNPGRYFQLMVGPIRIDVYEY